MATIDTRQQAARGRMGGFSLVEALIAALILGFGLVAIGRLQGVVLQDNSLSRQRLEAVNFAQQKLEELRTVATGSDFVALAGGSDTVGPGDDADQQVANLNTTYTRTWTVTSNNDGRSADIAVVVTWPDASGRTSAETTVGLGTVLSGAVASATAMDASLIPPSTTPDPWIGVIICGCDSGSGTGRHASLPGWLDGRLVLTGGMHRSTTTTVLNSGYCDDCCGTSSGTSFSRHGGHMMSAPVQPRGPRLLSVAYEPQRNNGRIIKVMGHGGSSSTEACTVDRTGIRFKH